MIRYEWQYDPDMGFILVRLRDASVMRSLTNSYVSPDWLALAAIERAKILRSTNVRSA